MVLRGGLGGGEDLEDTCPFGRDYLGGEGGVLTTE